MSRPPDPARRWWVLLVLCLSVLLVTIDNTIVNVALPTLGRELSATTSDLQWVVDGYTLAFAALLLPLGALGDRFGRRRVLQLGMGGFVLFSVLAAFSATSGQLVGSRVLMGIAAAAVYPATLALLVTAFPDRRERATAIGIWSAVSGLAIAIGPLAGGLLLEHFWWGSVFLVNVPLGVLALVAGRVLLSESRGPARRRVDVGPAGGRRAAPGGPPPGGSAVLGAVPPAPGIAVRVSGAVGAPGRGWTSAAT